MDHQLAGSRAPFRYPAKRQLEERPLDAQSPTEPIGGPTDSAEERSDKPTHLAGRRPRWITNLLGGEPELTTDRALEGRAWTGLRPGKGP